MGISTFLNDTTPTRLRGLLFLALSDTGNVLTPTSTSDSGGGATVTWTAGTAIPCRVDPLTHRIYGRETGGRIDERSTHIVTVPPGTSVNVQDRFAITGRGTFEVTAAAQQTAESSSTFEVIQTS